MAIGFVAMGLILVAGFVVLLRGIGLCTVEITGKLDILIHRLDDLDIEPHSYLAGVGRAQNKPDDKIPAVDTRYIPIARRRAMYEAESAKSQSHDAEVRANNERAMRG